MGYSSDDNSILSDDERSFSSPLSSEYEYSDDGELNDSYSNYASSATDDDSSNDSYSDLEYNTYRVAEKIYDRKEKNEKDLLDAIENDNVDVVCKKLKKMSSDDIKEIREEIFNRIKEGYPIEILSILHEEIEFSSKEIQSLITSALHAREMDFLNQLFDVADNNISDEEIIDVFTEIDGDFLDLRKCSIFYNNLNLINGLIEHIKDDNQEDEDNEMIIGLEQMRWSTKFGVLAQDAKFEKELLHLNRLVDYRNIELTCLRIITSVLYERKRHPWKSYECQLRLKMLQLFDSQKRYANYTQEQFEEYEEYLVKQERARRTYFGVDLSDDSDSEDEKRLKRNPERKTLLSSTQKMIDSLGKKRVMPQNKKKIIPISDEISLPENIPKYDEVKDHLIYKSISLRSQADLIRLNAEFKQAYEDNTVDTLLDQLRTKFVVLQVRGITYSTPKWGAARRRLHRKQNEVNQALYSHEVLSRTTNKNELLQDYADNLKKILVELRHTNSVSYQNETYDSAADAIQHRYTVKYDTYQNATKKFGLDLIDNPFISTADRPRHALRYAYGIKPYEGHKHERLRPRWQQSGKAERNKSGKVYVSIHPLSDYKQDGPISATHKVWDGAFFVNNRIISERETTFPAFMESDRIKFQHIAKYPSFHRPYKDIYLLKYGMDKELYTLFQEAINRTAPHTEYHRHAKQLLGDWLCHYQELCIMMEAKEYAVKNGLQLIYRCPDFKFSFELPPDTPHRKSKKVSAEMKEAHAIKKAQIKRSEPTTTPEEIAKTTKDNTVELLTKRFGAFNIASNPAETENSAVPVQRRRVVRYG